MPPPNPESFIDMHFPAAGIDQSAAWDRQPNRPVAGGRYARTTAFAMNMRGYEPSTLRNRGGTRCGLKRYISTPLVSGWIVQDLGVVVSDKGTTVQQSNSGRVVTLVGVSQGNIYYAPAGATSWTQASSAAGVGTPPLNFTGLLQQAVNNQLVYFADGTNWVYFNPSTGTASKWVASSGTLPVDSSGNTPRGIATWRGRTVLFGLLLDPQNWFMSAIGDPTNFNYSPTSQTSSQAIAGNNAPMGLLGDVINTFIPFSDDVAIVGCDHEIWMFAGDPADGGRLDLVSKSMGMAWGAPWCQDPLGNIYFVSNRMGIYTLVPGQQPQRISGPIESSILNIDTGLNGIRLFWSDRFQGVHVFITPLAAPAATTHFFYETQSQAWWEDEFANNNHNPLCGCVFDGNLAGDRVTLVGGWDGYVRSIDPTATTDDGTAINSEVWIGPILTPDLDDVMFKDLQAVLGETSGSVTVGVYVGPTAEAAAVSTAVATWTLNASRNFNYPIRRSGHALYVRITSSNPWTLETIRSRVQTSGKPRRRAKV